MSKTNRKRAGQAKFSQKEKVNPFEIRVNKVKHNVLGRKVCKNEVGKPFESRNKAFKKRNSTLYGEYKRKDKRGKGVVDRRLKDMGSGAELRKASVWKMKNAINCENVSLTHKGVDLNDANLRESYSDLDDEDNEIDLLRRSDYVESAHFGGGGSGTAKTAKEFMDEVFDEKRRKQVEKEANVELTEKLDKDWLSVKNLIQHKGAKSEVTDSTSDDYDVLVKQLAFNDNQRKPTLEVTRKNEQSDQRKCIVGKNQAFLETVNEILSCSDVSRVSELLDRLSEFQNLNSSTINTLKLVVQEMRHISLQSLSLLLLCSRISEVHDCYCVKSIQLIRNTKLNSIGNVVKCMCLIQLLTNTCEDLFFPEIVQVLQNILVLCLGENFVSFFFPFIALAKINKQDFLLVSDDCRVNAETLDLSFKHIFSSSFTVTCNNDFKMGVVKALNELISTVASRYKNLVSYKEIFSTVSFLSEKLSDRYSIDSVKVFVDDKNEKSYLYREKRKPVMLPLFEPRMEPRKRQESNKKLVKKYKREFKGAQRELKKDTQFMKDVWLKETLKKDQDRKHKVKRLYAELAAESSLYKKRK